LEAERRECRDVARPFSLFHFQLGRMPGTIYVPETKGQEVTGAGAVPTREDGAAFLALLDRMLETDRPDVLLTYGGHWLAWETMLLARRRGVNVVFWLRNLSYRGRELFAPTSAVVVPSHFAAEFYRQRLGLDCTVLPSPLNWERLVCAEESSHCEQAGLVGGTNVAAEAAPGGRRERDDGAGDLCRLESRARRSESGGLRPPLAGRRFLTFVNPEPAKGVFVFARIALELAHRRPEIPLLVVESRGQAKPWLERTGLDLSGLNNLHRLANTPDPRQFYSVSRAVLMPSLCAESFGRVAAEAMINGIPALVSNRGALPEVAGEMGVIRLAGIQRGAKNPGADDPRSPLSFQNQGAEERALVLDLPSRLTPKTREAPTAAEVSPWVETIIRLWDDSQFYEAQQRRCLAVAQAWRPETLANQYDLFFRRFILR
jgi:glycosyltransferase involved in cell wall biosynthesis